MDKRTTKKLIDTSALSKKYKCNVPRIIRAWKKGTKDQEIAREIGIAPPILLQIRQEITLVHERERYHKLPPNLTNKTSFFLRPW